MAFNSNDHTLAQHLDKLNLKTESKYDEETIDEAIINGLKGEHKAFCLRIESFLNQFMASPKTNEVIPSLDKYQRKIVHKICDLYNIKRDYVDVNLDDTGSITLTKSESSFVPSVSLEERNQKYLEKNKKQTSTQSTNPFGNKKVLIKTRANQPDKKSHSDKNEQGNSNKDSQDSKLDVHDEIEHKKKKEYEQARDRILQETEQRQPAPEIVEPNNPNKANSKSKKKGRFEGYDPDYDRFRSQQNANVSGMNTIGPPVGLIPGMGMPNMGMPNMYQMPGMVMPGMGGMQNMHGGMGFYPMQNQQYIPYPSFQGPNTGGYQPQPNFNSYNNFSNPPQQFQGGNQQFQGGNQQSNTTGGGNAGPIGPTGGTGTNTTGYFQNFPTLGKDGGKKP